MGFPNVCVLTLQTLVQLLLLLHSVYVHVQISAWYDKTKEGKAGPGK